MPSAQLSSSGHKRLISLLLAHFMARSILLHCQETAKQDNPQAKPGEDKKKKEKHFHAPARKTLQSCSLKPLLTNCSLFSYQIIL